MLRLRPNRRGRRCSTRRRASRLVLNLAGARIDGLGSTSRLAGDSRGHGPDRRFVLAFRPLAPGLEGGVRIIRSTLR